MSALKEYDAVRLVRDDADSGLKAGAEGVLLSPEEEDGTFLAEFFLDKDVPARGELFRVSSAVLAKL